MFFCDKKKIRINGIGMEVEVELVTGEAARWVPLFDQNHRKIT